MSTNKLITITENVEPKRRTSKSLSTETVHRMLLKGQADAIKTVHYKAKDGTIKNYYYLKDKFNTLVDSHGKINDKAVSIYLDQMKEDGATPSTIERAKQEIKIFAKEHQRDDGDKKRLSKFGLEARLAENSWLTMFWNAGIDPDYAAAYADTTVAELCKDDNWQRVGDKDQYIFTNPDTGTKYLFTWGYYNSTWEEI